MRLTKLGHACVRLDTGDATLVIDPGPFSGPGLLDGASAVLITHEHVDHVDADLVRAALAADPDLTVWTTAAVAAQFGDAAGRVHVVAHGDALEIAGVDVHVYGAKHAQLHPEIDPPDNVGFSVAGAVFHPGDALTVPEDPVRTLLAPINAPWLCAVDLIRYARAVAPQRLYGVHDGLLNEIGLGVVDSIVARLASETGGEARRLPAGTSVEV